MRVIFQDPKYRQLLFKGSQKELHKIPRKQEHEEYQLPVFLKSLFEKQQHLEFE